MFSFGGGLASLADKPVGGLKPAAENARALMTEVVTRLDKQAAPAQAAEVA